MFPRALLRLFAVTALAALSFVAAPTAAALSCAHAAEVFEDSDDVFTGKIVDTSRGRLIVDVKEVWKGEPQPAQVRLGVDLPGWSEWGDDGYSSPDLWVFMVDRTGKFAMTTGPCSAYRADEEWVQPLRPKVLPAAQILEPTEITRPAGSDDSSTARPMLISGAAVAGAVVIGLAVALFRRGRAR